MIGWHEPRLARMDSALAIIPARGGSKGILHKNLQEVGGIPLIGRTVLAATSSKRVGRIVVTTDDDVIANVACEYGAMIVRRNSELSSDAASSESAIKHALDVLSVDSSLEPELVFLQCTSPFTEGSQIDLVLSALDDKHYNSSFSVSSWHGFLWNKEGSAVGHNPFEPRIRRQDLEPLYIETGAIYTVRSDSFLKTHNRFCFPWKPVPISGICAEIDTIQDLELCRLLGAASRED